MKNGNLSLRYAHFTSWAYYDYVVSLFLINFTLAGERSFCGIWNVSYLCLCSHFCICHVKIIALIFLHLVTIPNLDIDSCICRHICRQQDKFPIYCIKNAYTLHTWIDLTLRTDDGFPWEWDHRSCYANLFAHLHGCTLVTRSLE